mmetsp:Transcript_12229/g.25330  ORF Transcript_12229/g.25330 Transcript_12229/m.25330 type:complete len:85 (+) Transcript_12229:249-503(+)
MIEARVAYNAHDTQREEASSSMIWSLRRGCCDGDDSSTSDDGMGKTINRVTEASYNIVRDVIVPRGAFNSMMQKHEFQNTHVHY